MLCEDGGVARTKDPAVRTLLVERAARMLRTREPITLRSLVEGTGVSTMAVYTWFGGVDGLWTALRQEGFTRLAARYDALSTSADPVRDLAALVAAYLGNALDHPDLYRVMFDATVDLADRTAAEATLEHLVRAAERAREAGRFRTDTDPRTLATRAWVVAHGLVSLVTSGVLSRRALADGVPLMVALFVGAGDDPDRCRASVEAGWTVLDPS
jgi:AcrR family transcriptional regulator